MWPRAKLKFVARLIYGDSLPRDDPLDGAFRVFGSNGPFANYSRANTGAPVIIVGRKGSYGKVNWTTEPCFASDTTFFVDQSSTRNHLRWVYWLLQTLRLDKGTVEAAVPGLNRETAYSNDVFVPPLLQQQMIADFLDRETACIDLLIEKKQRLVELADEKRSALITAAVTGQINCGAAVRSGGVMWPRAKLKFVARLIYGDSLPRDDPLDGAFRVFGSNGPFANYSRANTGAPVIIVGRKGSYGKVNWTTEPCFASDTTFFVDQSSSRNQLRWVYWLLQTLRLDKGTVEAAVPGLNRETAYSNDVFVLPLPQQQMIADFLDRETARIDALKTKTLASIDSLRELRAALITAAVTGQIDVTA